MSQYSLSISPTATRLHPQGPEGPATQRGTSSGISLPHMQSPGHWLGSAAGRQVGQGQVTQSLLVHGPVLLLFPVSSMQSQGSWVPLQMLLLL